MERPWEGTVAAADLDHTAGHQGPAQGGGRRRWGAARGAVAKHTRWPRGHDAKDRPAMSAWGRRPGAVVRQATSAGTVQTVQTAATIAVPAGRRLSPDSARSSRAWQGSGQALLTHTQKA
jgi:hypothetical protein